MNIPNGGHFINAEFSILLAYLIWIFSGEFFLMGNPFKDEINLIFKYISESMSQLNSDCTFVRMPGFKFSISKLFKPYYLFFSFHNVPSLIKIYLNYYFWNEPQISISSLIFRRIFSNNIVNFDSKLKPLLGILFRFNYSCFENEVYLKLTLVFF